MQGRGEPQTQSCSRCFADRPLREYQGDQTLCYECRLKERKGPGAAVVQARMARTQALCQARDRALGILRRRHYEEYEQIYLGEIAALGYDPESVVKNRRNPVGRDRKPRVP